MTKYIQPSRTSSNASEYDTVTVVLTHHIFHKSPWFFSLPRGHVPADGNKTADQALVFHAGVGAACGGDWRHVLALLLLHLLRSFGSLSFLSVICTTRSQYKIDSFFIRTCGFVTQSDGVGATPSVRRTVHLIYSLMWCTFLSFAFLRDLVPRYAIERLSRMGLYEQVHRLGMLRSECESWRRSYSVLSVRC